jgi:hypothetical protein
MFLYDYIQLIRRVEKIIGNILDETIFYKVPYNIKCIFDQPRCIEGDITGWTVLHSLLYFMLGFFAPNQYTMIITISITFEIFEQLIGQRSKLIIDVFTNVLSYYIGSSISIYS